MIHVEISNRRPNVHADDSRMRRAIERIVADAGYRRAQISVAIVDDATMRPLNKQYLDHDFATDVLSFVLEATDDTLEGDIVVSSEYAEATAARFDWSAEDELLLYVVHGALHLVGYDDRLADDQQAMREQELRYLAEFGLRPNYEDRA